VAWSWWRWVPNPKICNFSWIHGSFGADGQHFSHGKLTRALQFRHKMKKKAWRSYAVQMVSVTLTDTINVLPIDTINVFFVVVNVGS
jgi:hypothetical protein